jgi:hypothetical protein
MSGIEISGQQPHGGLPQAVLPEYLGGNRKIPTLALFHVKRSERGRDAAVFFVDSCCEAGERSMIYKTRTFRIEKRKLVLCGAQFLPQTGKARFVVTLRLFAGDRLHTLFKRSCT